MNHKNEAIEPLKPEDITLNCEKGIIWRLCLRNGWAFVPDFSGGEPFIDLKCAACLLGIAERTIQNYYMHSVPRYVNGLVRLSEVMQRREDEATNKNAAKVARKIG